jgi:hypothetical protein
VRTVRRLPPATCEPRDTELAALADNRDEAVPDPAPAAAVAAGPAVGTDAGDGPAGCPGALAAGATGAAAAVTGASPHVSQYPSAIVPPHPARTHRS